MKGRTIKLVKEDIGEYLMTLEKILGKDSLNVIQKELTINEKIANRTLKSPIINIPLRERSSKLQNKERH